MSDKPMIESEIRAAHIGSVVPLTTPILIVESDPKWPQLFEREAATIRSALGDRVLLLEHAGSTSVPGLAAKPIIDIILAASDSADELAYASDLEIAGYVLTVREPGWHEHRMFKRAAPVHLHVFSSGCPEIGRMLVLRDWLRRNDSDRKLYEDTKRELARQNWTYMQNYADAKTTVIDAILARAEAN